MKGLPAFLPCAVASLILFSPQATTAQAPAQVIASQFRLEDGTPVKLRLQETISSADAQVDQRVDFDVLDEIKVGDLQQPKSCRRTSDVSLDRPARKVRGSGAFSTSRHPAWRL